MTKTPAAACVDALEPRRLFAFPRTDLDDAFGARGVAAMNVSEQHEFVFDMVALPDGSTLTVVETSNGQSVLLRHGPGGAPDLAFGTNGRFTLTTSDAVERLDAVAVAPDGKIVLAGIPNHSGGIVINPPPQPDAVVYRLNPNGSRDVTFGDAGRSLLDLGQGFSFERCDVEVDPQGRIVFSDTQSLTPPNGSTFSVVRLTPEGNLDTTFGGDGIVTAEFGGGTALADTLLLQGDGKIIVAGTWRPNPAPHLSNDRFTLARFNPDGTPDATFGGGDGIATADVGGRATSLGGAALRPDGRVFVAGTAADPFTQDIHLAFGSFNPDGTPDATFADGGTTFANTRLSSASLDGVALAPDGVAYATGEVRSGAGRRSDGKVALVRVGTDGRAKLSTFAVSPGTLDADRGAAIAARPGGGVVIAAVTGGGPSGRTPRTTDVVLAGVTRGDQGALLPPPGPILPPRGPLEFRTGSAVLRVHRGVLTVFGSDSSDSVSAALRADGGSAGGTLLDVTVNGATWTLPPAGDARFAVRRIVIHGLGGDDQVDVRAANLPTTARGGAGNDTLLTGSAPDLLIGGAGEDITNAGPEDVSRP